MTVDVAIDTELLKREIKKTYAAVSQEPGTDFIFPTGRAWAEDLGYPPELAAVPDAAAESFAGVANPWVLGRLSPGEHVLDLGCGVSSARPRCLRTPPAAGTRSSSPPSGWL